MGLIYSAVPVELLSQMILTSLPKGFYATGIAYPYLVKQASQCQGLIV